MDTINWQKVREAARTMLTLNAGETEALFNLVASVNETRDTPKRTAGTPKPEAPTRPDPRGRYKCSLCDKVLPTKRGRGIHEARVHKTGDLFPKETK